MADIRIKDLPLATGPTAPTGTDSVAIDSLTTRRTTVTGFGDVAVPIASQAEAEAGLNATKRMVPVTVKQSIASEVGITLASKAQGDLADSALQASDIGTGAGTVAAGNDARIVNGNDLLTGMITAFPYTVESRRYNDIGFQSFLFDAADSQYPTFGPAAIHGRATAKYNGVIGETIQDGSNGNSFPSGVLGYAGLRNAGNAAFGFFGRVDQYTAGCATHEFNTFNYSAAAPSTFPWSRAFGISTSVPVCLTVAAGGAYVSAAGIEIGEEGSEPNAFQIGIAVQKKGVKQWSYFQDADATDGPNSGMYMAIPGAGINLVLKTTGTASAKNGVMQIVNAAGNERASIRQDGSACFGTTAGSVVAARLNVAGGDTVRGIPNTSAMIGLDLSAANPIGAAVQIGSINGNTPFIAASRYSTSEATASPLIIMTDATERVRVLATPGNGLGIVTPVPVNSYANDAAAAAAGIPVGGWYRNGSAINIRVS